MFCPVEKVVEKYIEREKSGNWDEEEDREDTWFLEEEKKFFLDKFPHNKEMFEEENDDGN